MRISPTNQNVHKRMITNLIEVLFVSLCMFTLGRFRLCVRRPLPHVLIRMYTFTVCFPNAIIRFRASDSDRYNAQLFATVCNSSQTIAVIRLSIALFRQICKLADHDMQSC